MGLDNTINQFVALNLGAAIRKVFPHCSYQGCGILEGGFYAQFRDDQLFDQAYLDLLRAEIDLLVDNPIPLQEMLASNAAELLSHHRENHLSKVLRELAGMVMIAQIGPYYDICHDEIEKSKIFILESFSQVNGSVTIYGRAFYSKENLKNYQKRKNKYSNTNHGKIAADMQIYEKNFWHPNGIRLLHILKESWREYLRREGIEEIYAPNPIEYFRETKRAEFGIWDGFQDQIYIFNCEKEISLLQMIEKWIKIFDFEAKWKLPKVFAKYANQLSFEAQVSSEGSAELYLADALGCFWQGPVLAKQKNRCVFSLCGNLARFVALYIERTQGQFPFLFAPEQVRLIPVGTVDVKSVLQEFEELKIRYYVDEAQRNLKEKMHLALRAKVPYVMVFGKKEENEGAMTIRAYNSDCQKTVPLDQLKKFLSEQES